MMADLSLDVWFRDDIERVLRGLEAAAERCSWEYHEALRAVALSFGIEWEPAVGATDGLTCLRARDRVHLLPDGSMGVLEP